MDISWGNYISAYEIVIYINADIALVSVMINTIFFPMSIKIPLSQATWVDVPFLGQISSLDDFILRSSISLHKNRYKSGMNNLTIAGFQTLRSQLLLKTIEKFFINPSFVKLFTKKCDGCYIWNCVHHTKADEFLVGSLVVDLESKLSITEVKRLLQYQYYEEDMWIDPSPACIAFSLIGISLFKH